jgi:hypothetical protein
MNFMKTIAIFIARIFTRRMIDGFVLLDYNPARLPIAPAAAAGDFFV